MHSAATATVAAIQNQNPHVAKKTNRIAIVNNGAFLIWILPEVEWRHHDPHFPHGHHPQSTHRQTHGSHVPLTRCHQNRLHSNLLNGGIGVAIVNICVRLLRLQCQVCTERFCVALGGFLCFFWEYVYNEFQLKNTLNSQQHKQTANRLLLSHNPNKTSNAFSTIAPLPDLSQKQPTAYIAYIPKQNVCMYAHLDS